MSTASLRDTLNELAALVRNDELRGSVGTDLLAVRFQAALDAHKAREPYAYRQALLELAACATSLTTRLPAPSAPVPQISKLQEPAAVARPLVDNPDERPGTARRQLAA